MEFIANPRQWVIDAGLNPDDDAVGPELEKILKDALARLAESVPAVDALTGTAQEVIKGVGVSCCN
ncbi:hypothetical protein AWC12_16155 [Mycolicibacterium iranicum]|uniref:Uncharacterized protein n=1 Tax=Mycolicibacterium iranicum TaxID=912594 RepID=A0A1X1WMT4_MYCIR|nr:hypothetical protein AWC12_16155 [Mycolicibacterium iranicum]